MMHSCRYLLKRPLPAPILQAGYKQVVGAHQGAPKPYASYLPSLQRPQTSHLHGTAPRHGLEEFIESSWKANEDIIYGRAWTVQELRNKCFDDLHALWFVLYKERNRLMTERIMARRNGGDIRAKQRIIMVKQGMKAIQVVLGERRRVKRSIQKENRQRRKAEEWEEKKKALLANA
ncbi:unnamed protein product, partial [Chrysoparadoxa australica]